MTPVRDLLLLQADIRRCQRCQEAGFSVFSSPVFSGQASARLMLIGQAPGVTEAEVSRPFNGDAGRRLFRFLEGAGWEESDFRERCYMTSVTKCFPGKAKKGGGDRVPSAKERALCRPWLDTEIELVRPEVIVTVGRLAASLFFPGDPGLSDLVGKPHTVAERLILPLPHPSGVSRWHVDSHNQQKLETAIAHLAQLKVELRL